MRHHRSLAGNRRNWLLALAAIIAANGFFLVFNLLGAVLPTEPVTVAVRTAFAEGDLGLEDWLPFDHRRGFNQLNDCSILLMGLNREGPALQRAVGQRLTFRSERWAGFCQTLYETVHERPHSMHRLPRPGRPPAGSPCGHRRGLAAPAATFSLSRPAQP
jgi:hypothetical protein